MSTNQNTNETAMTKKEAAAFLGMSERTLERHTSQNRIGVRYEKGKTFDVAVYDRGELERFKTELERPIHRPAVQRLGDQNGSATNGENSDSTALSPLASFDAIERIIAATAQATVQSLVSSAPPAQQEKPTKSTADIAAQLLLNLDDAAQLSRIPKSTLRNAIDVGTLKAAKIGRSWKVRPDDLKAYLKKLF